MLISIFPYLIVLGLCLALSFICSGMEAGVFALNRLRIRQQMKAGRRAARVLYGFLENTENFLWTILIGNTLGNFVVVLVVVVGLHRELRGWLWLQIGLFVLLIFLFYVLCDLLPKMLFRQFPNRLCLAMALPFRGIHLVLSPLVRIVEWFSSRLLQWTGGKIFSGHLFANRSELRLFMQESAQNLTSEERAMINRVLDLQNITVRSVAVAWNRAISVSTQTPASEVLKLFAENQFSRVPVCSSDAGPRRVLGVVSLDSLIYEPEIPSGKTAGDYMKPALFLNEDLRLEEALRQMQRSGQRLAIVLGLDRKELGIVALSDVLKTIFGEVGHL